MAKVSANTAAGKEGIVLHGNWIVKRQWDGRKWIVTLSDCGWRTPTTKERLNPVLWFLTGGLWTLRQRKGHWELVSRDKVVPWPGQVQIVELDAELVLE